MLLLLLTVFLIGGIPVLLHSWKYRTIRHIPGPKGLPVLGNLFLFYNCDILQIGKELSKTYGDVFKFSLGPSIRWLAICNREMIEFFLRSPKYVTKSYNYRFLAPWLGYGVLISDGKRWQVFRKLLLPAFHFKPLQEHITTFNAETDTFIEILQKHVGKEEFDIFPYATNLTLDIACKTTMGIKLNVQKNPENEFMRAVHTLSEIIVERSLSIWKGFDFLFWFSRKYTEQKEALKTLHGFTDNIIHKRKQQLIENNELTFDKLDQNLEENKIIIDLLLKSTINGESLSEETIRNIATEIIFGAHDTTASAISILFYELARRPEIQEKVVNELRIVFGNDKDRPVTYTDLCELKYMEAVIKESLRFNAPVPYIGRQLTQDVEYKGTVLPKGLNIVFLFHQVHKCSDIYEDPDVFNPDRFLDTYANRALLFLPFSYGVRNCLGQKYAINELKVVFGKVLRHFEIVCERPEEDLKFVGNLVLKAAHGANIKLRRRHF